ncbi:MAG: NusG domain II-containing protein [Ignavibacteriaceae bacterium]|nr:NusG domain II-containing protein [Ignavibacteriaceae bacterium]
MISRRSFLKSIGVSAVALGAGFGTAKIFNGKNKNSFSVHGFLPADEKIIAEAVRAFVKKTGSSQQPIIMAENKIKEVVQKAYFSADGNNSFSGRGNVTFRIVKMNRRVQGDILLSDDKVSIYNPNEDFNGSFIYLRSKLQNRKAEYFFSAEYNESNLINSLLRGNNRTVVIENENGLVDKISLNGNYKNISVTGPQGKTGLKLENGLVNVHTSTCRHELCKQSGFASHAGDVLACAPNKVLIKIETI